ncbi:hypothetical protein RFI_03706 [Reticulomyxa filosa]|uniref:Serpin domain-containing protein n=1 Tax=Reticulomyxa filosa TaxID=46433 RepID=X6P5L8_RETFI|nr:hypothetical protein RFI_03706 [Reticulomyxa filosa]|eukprot:ETO33403.1 hypothetical protein RFI_03706 [Reticulomyxa filosa]
MCNSLNEFYSALKKSKRQVMELSFPKLRLDTFVDLSSVLEEPLDNTFDVTEADFSRMSKKAKELGLCVSQLIHNVRLVVDEMGENALPDNIVKECTDDKESFNYPFDVYLMNATQDQIFLCGRIGDPDPSIPFQKDASNEPHDINETNDNEVKDVRQSKWRCCF